jgi:hypothetical protein
MISYEFSHVLRGGRGVGVVSDFNNQFPTLKLGTVYHKGGQDKTIGSHLKKSSGWFPIQSQFCIWMSSIINNYDYYLVSWQLEGAGQYVETEEGAGHPQGSSAFSSAHWANLGGLLILIKLHRNWMRMSLAL